MSFIVRVCLSTPAVLIAACIFILSDMPHPEFPDLGIVWEDKIMHISAYFVFGISIILFLLANLKNPVLRQVIVITFIVGAVYGFSDEFHQYFVPGRSAEILDWCADLTGLFVSTLLIKYIKNKMIRVPAT